jgi:hypothetical protein
MSATDDFRPSLHPSHKAYGRASAGDNARLTEIGFAYQHRDGKGCEIRLDGGRVIVLRPIEEVVPS